jgi:hypothetical protein
MDNEVPEPIEAEQPEKTCPNYSAEVEDADFDYDARALVVPRVSYQKGLTQERREHKADHYTKSKGDELITETIAARAAFRNGWERTTVQPRISRGKVQVGKQTICTVATVLHCKNKRNWESVTWLRSFVSHAVNSTTPPLETSERTPRYFRGRFSSDATVLVCHCCKTAQPRVPWGEQGYATPQNKVERLRVKMSPPKARRWVNLPYSVQRCYVLTAGAVSPVQKTTQLPYSKPLGWTAPPDWTLLRVWTVPPETPEPERPGIVESLRVLTSKTMNLCHSDRVRFSEYNCRAWFPWFILPAPPSDDYQNHKWDAAYVSPWSDVTHGTAKASADAFDQWEPAPNPFWR